MTRRRHPLPLLLLITTLLTLAPARGQEAETLLLQVSLEGELLGKALERYRDARDGERLASERFTDLGVRVDELLARDEPPLDELRARERELVDAAAALTAGMARTAQVRAEIGDRLERLETLEARLAEVGGGPLVPDAGISGLWRVQIEPNSLFGLMRFQADGTLVTGTYVLSNGDQGSIRGTVIDGRVTLERIDASLGFIATLQGTLDAAGGRIAGDWTATTVSSGTPTTGSWTASRLARSLSQRPAG